MHGEIMIKDQSGDNLGNDGKDEEWLYSLLCLVDRNKGDNYVAISLWLVTSLVVPYVMAPMYLAYNELLKMFKLVH